MLGLLDYGLCSVDVICKSKILETDELREDLCYIDEFPFSNSDPETYNFRVDYARPSRIKKLQFVSTNGVFPTVANIPTQIFTIFPNLAVLRISSNLTELSAGDFAQAMKLSSIDLRENNLKIIRNNVFAPHPTEKPKKIDGTVFPLQQLDYLWLLENEIIEIEAHSFYGLDNLKAIELQSNQLSVIRKGTFTGLPSLNVLHLYNNKIEIIEDGAFDLPALEHLYLNQNKLKRLSDVVFDRLLLLSVLSLDKNELEHIGQSLYSLSNVINIWMEENRIRDIDLAAMAKLPQLELLTLWRSGFTFATTKIEDDQQWNSSLQTLDIGGNNLTDATELNKLRIFPNLKYLKLNGNSFADLEVGGNRTLKDILPSLRWLYMNGMTMNCETTLAAEQKLNAKYVSVYHNCLH